jgi:SAM-dependent methyltransferase
MSASPTFWQRLAERLRRLRSGASHRGESFAGSAQYWDHRYAAGGDSGAGSYGKFATFKARVLNGLFAELKIQSVVEFGCGDGNQLTLLKVKQYLGVDVSAQAVARCRERFDGAAGRRFVTLAEYAGEPADCALSLDVIYHLVEDPVYEAYMRQLFDAARSLVVVYSSNHEDPNKREAVHVRHREFTRWVASQAPHWRLLRHVPNAYPFRGNYREGSFADFYAFVRAG